MKNISYLPATTAMSTTTITIRINHIYNEENEQTLSMKVDKQSFILF
jgi:hypothetical protein